ncbi:hypothetical protein NDU88_004106 [Pleurodeles waltl]|uniref:Uncharacterized protein n=1 Tax=Pleurodeles waltl TaxID=8319 RepID=A0AAV7M926_PLEWA|nr:hypothetical protein NDU88_004106 [Pleurodeles waltl]
MALSASGTRRGPRSVATQGGESGGQPRQPKTEEEHQRPLGERRGNWDTWKGFVPWWCDNRGLRTTPW